MVDLKLPDDASEAVNSVLEWAIRERATDIHLSPLPSGPCVRARVDGGLHTIALPDAAGFRKIIARLKVLAEMNIAEKRRPQDGRIVQVIDEREVEFRASLVPALRGESIVLRVLDREVGLLDMAGLGMSRQEAGVFRSMISSPSGLITICGPTGAGKTTTLYAALLEVATPERNVVTIEDPVEYELPIAIQTRVQPKIGVGFADLLRSLLRHDPDVMMLGEIRDPETAQIAVRAALTGHLLLTSMHTRRSADAIGALLNLGVAPYALTSATRGAVAQQLVRKVCPDCKTSYEYGDELFADPDIARLLTPGTTPSFSVGLGCDNCFGEGYRGRHPLFEMLEVDGAVRDAIARGENAQAIEQAAINCGMLTLRQKGFLAVIEGTTTVEEVVRTVTIDD